MNRRSFLRCFGLGAASAVIIPTPTFFSKVTEFFTSFWKPPETITIELVRCPLPLAWDIFGVQPMTAPTGKIFEMKIPFYAQDEYIRAKEDTFTEDECGWVPRRPPIPLDGGSCGAITPEQAQAPLGKPFTFSEERLQAVRKLLREI